MFCLAAFYFYAHSTLMLSSLSPWHILMLFVAISHAGDFISQTRFNFSSLFFGLFTAQSERELEMSACECVCVRMLTNLVYHTAAFSTKSFIRFALLLFSTFTFLFYSSQCQFISWLFQHLTKTDCPIQLEQSVCVCVCGKKRLKEPSNC